MTRKTKIVDVDWSKPVDEGDREKSIRESARAPSNWEVREGKG